jgi:uncharacterized protein YbbC (DUF1343 family)
MAGVMEAAAEYHKEVIILDRPNPIGGKAVAGNVLDPKFASFVGRYPIPYRHGMTIAELALLFNKEFGIDCSLRVVPMVGWKRSMYWHQTGLHWVPTSPHVPHWETILHMAATGILGELGILSVGVGYTSPFEMIGAPWINGPELARDLNKLNLKGVLFRPLYFKPYYLNFKGEICQGIQLHITDYESFDPYSTGLYLMYYYIHHYPQHDLFAKKDRIKMFDKVVGTDKLRLKLQAGDSVEQIEQEWQTVLNQFKQIRQNYLIYN